MINECPFCGSIRIVETLKGDSSICLACESFLKDKSKQTLFDRITQSPEVLAEKLVFWMSWHNSDGSVEWFAVSTIAEGKWASKSEAIVATVAKLKEVEK